MTPSQQRSFDLIVAAAVAGERCPTNDRVFGTSSLARGGFIRIEVYALNYRVVEIAHGEHSGKRTAEPPRGGKPYRIIDKNGDRYLSRPKAGATVVRHVDHTIDREREAVSITLPRLSFLETPEEL